MENISVISTAKRKRGRPAKYTEAVYHMELGNAKTKRGKQNQMAALEAYATLRAYQESSGKPLFSYLLEPKQRTTILAELGRMDSEILEDQLLMLRTAYEICHEKMPTSTAIGRIRSVRGLGHPADALGLYEAIRRTITNYLALHKTVSNDEIERALEANLRRFKNGQIKLPFSSP